jgi:lysophospholipase L1-like esterase
MKKIKYIVTVLVIAVAGLAFIIQQKPTLYMVGDSTMHNDNKILWGWGTTIADLLDSTKITVVNSAQAGRSTRSYTREGRWAKVVASLKPGDFVIMGFGHGWYLRKFVKEAKAKGAYPIIVSMIPRREWDKEGKIILADKDYGLWAKQVAEQEGVPFVDVNGITAAKYNQMTHDQVFALFGTDHTHTNHAGAVINAQSFVEGLKLQPNIPLNKYVKAN